MAATNRAGLATWAATGAVLGGFVPIVLMVTLSLLDERDVLPQLVNGVILVVSAPVLLLGLRGAELLVAWLVAWAAIGAIASTALYTIRRKFNHS